MNNWIEIENYVGDQGEVLINLNSGVVVERVELLDKETLKPDCSVTKIWSLNNSERYLQGSPELYDKVKLVYTTTDKTINEISRGLFDISLNTDGIVETI